MKNHGKWLKYIQTKLLSVKAPQLFFLFFIVVLDLVLVDEEYVYPTVLTIKLQTL